MTRDEMISILKSNKVSVTFEKVDGTIREMNCTLLEEFLPVIEESKTKRAVNLETVSVWDLDKNAWRSFRVDSITKFETMKGD